MSSAACLGPEDVDLFLRGDLDRAAREAFAVHLADCGPCRVLLSTLARLQTPHDLDAMPPVPEREELSPRRGAQMGRYEILDCLGAGGMAVVYRAQDLELARKVALKVLRADVVGRGRDALQDRLRREAQAMARMAHPNVVAVYDVGMWDDRVFIAMELVEGVNLSQWLVQAPRSCRDVVAVFLRAGRGLVAAHAAGLVHRDFKPANVMVGDDGRVRVGDFGLARTARTAQTAQTTQTPTTPDTETTRDSREAVAGTPYYMAPEQLRGEPVSPRSDQFSFCVALHAALTGAHPLTGRRIEPLLATCSDATRSVPRWLQPILRRGLSLAREDRYPSMAVLLEAIARGPSRRRRVIAASAAAACAFAMVAVLAGHTRQADPSAAPVWFSEAPELREAFDREWRAMHTDACELSRASCKLQATNLLRDAWQTRPGSELARVDGHLRVSTHDAGDAMTQSVPWPVPPRRSYSLRVRVRVPPGQPPARGRLTLQAGNRDESVTTSRFLAGTDWSTASVTLSSSAHYRGLRVAVALETAGELEIDDGELVDAGLMDASFERAADSVNDAHSYRAATWVPYNKSNAVHLQSRVSDAFDGSRVLEVRSAVLGGSVAQDTDQTPLAGNTYVFTAWLRAGSPAVVAGTLALWALGKTPVMAITAFEVGQRWTPIQVSLSIHASDFAGLRTELYLNTTGVPLDIDATSLLPAGLVNASFEDEPVGWILPADAVRIVRDDVGRAKDGDAWLRMIAARDHDAIAQEVGAPASGATYTFSAWVRAPQGSASGQLLLRSVGGVPEAAMAAFQATREWSLVTTTLTIRRSEHVGMRVEVQISEAGSRLDVDGTRLTGANPG